MTDADILDFLRAQFARLHERHDKTDGDIADLKSRVGRLEITVADLHGDYARQSVRLDRIETRLDRIEKRLDLAEAPAG
jgi:predicted nuclease with TOPRIM domain